MALFADFVVTAEVATAATDGKRLLFNPAFVAKQNPSQLCGLIAHELLHAGLQHVTHRRERDPELWNISADIVVNGMIVGDTSYTLPEGGVENVALAHLSVEEIYEQLQSGKLKRPSITRRSKAICSLLTLISMARTPSISMPIFLRRRVAAAHHLCRSSTG
jgi:predicted metal-dependent peptidase